MENLIESSLILTYWKCFATITVIFAIFKYLKKEKQLKNNTHTKLAEEEYIGEFNDDNVKADIDNHLSPFLELKEHIPFHGATIKLTGGIDVFYDIVNNRRSVRKYSKKNVPLDIIRKCIQCAGTSPSGAHTEPWTFCLISDMKIKQEIRSLVEAEEYQNYKQRMARQWVTDLSPLNTNFIKEYLTDAPYLILVFKKIYGFCKDGKKQQHYYNEISVSIATGILLCALQAAGLNSLITTPLNCGPVLRALLNRPENEKLLVLLPVGYAADDCLVPDLKRKSINDILVEY